MFWAYLAKIDPSDWEFQKKTNASEEEELKSQKSRREEEWTPYKISEIMDWNEAGPRQRARVNGTTGQDGISVSVRIEIE